MDRVPGASQIVLGQLLAQIFEQAGEALAVFGETALQSPLAHR